MSKKYEYTLDDCDCRFCLHHDKKTKGCQLEFCCCLEEKRAALARLRHTGKSRAEQCRV